MTGTTLYCAQVFSSPQRPIRYCSKPHPTREAAIAELRRKRPEAASCMTCEARFNENAGGIVPTHYGIESHHFPAGKPTLPDRIADFWLWLFPKP